MGAFSDEMRLNDNKLPKRKETKHLPGSVKSLNAGYVGELYLFQERREEQILSWSSFIIMR